MTDEAPRPPLHDQRIGDGKVVKERFIGPLAGRVSRQAIGRIRWRSEAGRCGGAPEMIEDLPDLPAGRQATAGRSITATTYIVPPQRGHRRGSTSYTFRIR